MNNLYGSIQITPTVPDFVLAFSRFGDHDASWSAGTDLYIDTQDGNSVIKVTSEEERGSRDGAANDLKEIIELLGDGYTYDGELKGNDGDSESLYILSIQNGKVVDLEGTVVYGLGPIGQQMSGGDIETALATLAELWPDVTPHQFETLSERQIEVIEDLHERAED